VTTLRRSTAPIHLSRITYDLIERGLSDYAEPFALSNWQTNRRLKWASVETQSLLLEADIAVLPDYYMVEHLDVE
jgi:hypothetical protein